MRFNRGEFTLNEFNKFCKGNAICLLTISRSPQQNGVSKRKTRPLLIWPKVCLRVRNYQKNFGKKVVDCAMYL